MSYQATVLEIMIASPSDVNEERSLTQQTIHEWNYTHSASREIVLMPVGWDTHSVPTMGDRPQAIINKQVLEDCDLLIGIFWTRIGTRTGEALSGTAEEIERHMTAGKPAMIYFSSRPVALDSVDRDQYDQLQAFKQKCKERGIVESFDSPEDFRRKLSRQLAKTVNEDKYIASLIPPIPGHLVGDIPHPHSAPSQPSLTLSKEAEELLLEASQDQEGQVLRYSFDQGIILMTNRKQFGNEHDPRITAIWQDAFNQLIDKGLLQPHGNKGVIFKVTRRGFDLVDRIRSPE